MKYMVICVGCIECGVTTAIVGVLETEAEADALAVELDKSREWNWREGGDNSYEVFPLPTEPGLIGEWKDYKP